MCGFVFENEAAAHSWRLQSNWYTVLALLQLNIKT